MTLDGLAYVAFPDSGVYALSRAGAGNRLTARQAARFIELITSVAHSDPMSQTETGERSEGRRRWPNVHPRTVGVCEVTVSLDRSGSESAGCGARWNVKFDSFELQANITYSPSIIYSRHDQKQNWEFQPWVTVSLGQSGERIYTMVWLHVALNTRHRTR